MSKQQSESLLYAHRGWQYPGKYLVRSTKTAVNNAILSVVVADGVAHFLLERSSPGSEYLVNKVPTGQTKISALIDQLKVRPMLGLPCLTRAARPLSSSQNN